MMFSLKIETLDADPFVIMTLHGTIAGVTVYELKHEGNRLIDYLGRHIVVLDMAAVDMIDSAGIGVILHFFKTCKNMGGRLAVVQPSSEDAMRPLYQASLERFLDFYANLPSALDGLCQRLGLNLPPALKHVVNPGPEEKALEQRMHDLEERVKFLEHCIQRMSVANGQVSPFS